MIQSDFFNAGHGIVIRSSSVVRPSVSKNRRASTLNDHVVSRIRSADT